MQYACAFEFTWFCLAFMFIITCISLTPGEAVPSSGCYSDPEFAPVGTEFFFVTNNLFKLAAAETGCANNVGSAATLARISSIDEFNLVETLVLGSSASFTGDVMVGVVRNPNGNAFFFLDAFTNTTFVNGASGVLPWASAAPGAADGSKVTVAIWTFTSGTSNNWSVIRENTNAGGGYVCRLDGCAPPTFTPTTSPTSKPPTKNPTRTPTNTPSIKSPTRSPTVKPTTENPTRAPTAKSTTGTPTRAPIAKPATEEPTRNPTNSPTQQTFIGTGSPVPGGEPSPSSVTKDPSEIAIGLVGSLLGFVAIFVCMFGYYLKTRNSHLQKSKDILEAQVIAPDDFFGQRVLMLNTSLRNLSRENLIDDVEVDTKLDFELRGPTGGRPETFGIVRLEDSSRDVAAMMVSRQASDTDLSEALYSL